MIKIKRIKRTCFACTSQWNAWTEDGYTVYIRYRHGLLSVRESFLQTDNPEEAVSGRVIYEDYHGNEWDGVMDYKELKELTKGLVEYPKEEEEDEEI